MKRDLLLFTALVLASLWLSGCNLLPTQPAAATLPPEPDAVDRLIDRITETITP